MSLLTVESKKSNRHDQQQPDASPPNKNRGKTVFAWFRRTPLTKKIVIVGSVVIFIVVAGLVLYRLSSSDRPNYQTILPDGKSVAELGGWKRVSPPEKEPVFAYTDKIGNVPVTVSQQPLPPSFKNEAALRVAELAKGYNATTKLAADDVTFYLGTSSKGPQSVIFTKKDLLILIKSQAKVENTAWENYIKSLGNPGGSGTPKY